MSWCHRFGNYFHVIGGVLSLASMRVLPFVLRWKARDVWLIDSVEHVRVWGNNVCGEIIWNGLGEDLSFPTWRPLSHIGCHCISLTWTVEPFHRGGKIIMPMPYISSRIKEKYFSFSSNGNFFWTSTMCWIFAAAGIYFPNECFFIRTFNNKG